MSLPASEQVVEGSSAAAHGAVLRGAPRKELNLGVTRLGRPIPVGRKSKEFRDREAKLFTYTLERRQRHAAASVLERGKGRWRNTRERRLLTKTDSLLHSQPLDALPDSMCQFFVQFL